MPRIADFALIAAGRRCAAKLSIAIALGLTAAVAATAPAAADVVLVMHTTTPNYAVKQRLSFDETLALNSGESVRLYMPNTSTRVIEGPVSGTVSELLSLDGGRGGFSDSWEFLRQLFFGENSRGAATVFRNEAVMIDEWPISEQRIARDPLIFCIEGGRPTLRLPLIGAGNQISVTIAAQRGDAFADKVLTHGDSSVTWPEAPVDGAVYRIGVTESISTHVEMRVVDSAVLRPGPERTERLLRAECAVQARHASADRS